MVVFLIHHARTPDAADAIARRLRWHDCTPTAVWASPAPLARMTATRLVEILEWTGPLEVVDELGADRSDPTAAVAALSRTAPDGAVVVVAHEPLLTALAARLVAAGAERPLAPAEAMRVDDGVLRWRFAHDDLAPVRGERS